MKCVNPRTSYVVAALYLAGEWAYRQFLTDGQGKLSMGATFLSFTGLTIMILNPEIIMPAIIITSLVFLIQRALVRIPSGVNWNFGSYCYNSSNRKGNVYDHQ